MPNIIKTLVFLLFSLLALVACRPSDGKPNSAGTDAGQSTTPVSPARTNGREQLMQMGFQVFPEETRPNDFRLVDLSGNTHTLQEFKGKVLVLNFWATWCPPCREEMPSMEALYQTMKGSEFALVAVNLQEDADQVRTFTQAQGYHFTVLLDQTGSVGAQYGARSIPITYIIDRNGFILARTIGAREWNSPELIRLFQDLSKQ